jgi:hypothetical protein
MKFYLLHYAYGEDMNADCLLQKRFNVYKIPTVESGCNDD